ncbi:MAG: phosphate ABC transporter permease PstA [Flavobacteriaceae bacterium]|jgi:phosphate transport system permease protein|nr:phosphate ABC transporter permease PstA [Flavobacteriaceae bacterium]
MEVIRLNNHAGSSPFLWRADRKKGLERDIRKRDSKDRAVFRLVCLFSALAMIPLFLIIGELILKGYKHFSINLFTRTEPTSMDAMIAKSVGASIPGGILNGITGSLLTLLISIVIAVPLGILIGIFLADNPKRSYSSLVRSLSDLIQGIPSIVIGIIVYAWVVKPLHQYSALAGGVALAIMMLPLIIRSTEESLKMLPISLREAGTALGCSHMDVVLKILLPSALGGLFTGILLAVSRVLGETAPLLVTVLGSSVVNWDILKPVNAIPLLIWQFYNDPNLADLVWSSSLFLLIIVLGINLGAKNLSKKWKIS